MNVSPHKAHADLSLNRSIKFPQQKYQAWLTMRKTTARRRRAPGQGWAEMGQWGKFQEEDPGLQGTRIGSRQSHSSGSVGVVFQRREACFAAGK